MTEVLIVCFDDKHAYLCRLPCEACEEDCDKTKRRPATEAEKQLYEYGEGDTGFRGVVNNGE